MKHIKHILYIIPDDKNNDLIIKKVFSFAAKKQAEITFLHVIKKIPREVQAIFNVHEDTDINKILEKDALVALEKNLKQLKNQKSKYHVKVLIGDKYALTIKELENKSYDLLITTDYESKGKLSERFFGSKHLFLLRHAPNPVLVFRPGRKKKKYRMLVAIDLEDMTPEKAALNQKIIDYALACSIYDDVEIHIISCWKLYGESALQHGFLRIPDDKLKAMQKQCKQHYQNNFNEFIQHTLELQAGIIPSLLKGNPVDLIPQYVQKQHIDMVVIGTVSRKGVPGLTIGNTAEDIMQKVDCSILMVKP
jgi:universal stress protein E